MLLYPAGSAGMTQSSMESSSSTPTPPHRIRRTRSHGSPVGPPTQSRICMVSPDARGQWSSQRLRSTGASSLIGVHAPTASSQRVKRSRLMATASPCGRILHGRHAAHACDAPTASAAGTDPGPAARPGRSAIWTPDGTPILDPDEVLRIKGAGDPPGVVATCGSARTRWAICRPPASTPPDVKPVPVPPHGGASYSDRQKFDHMIAVRAGPAPTCADGSCAPCAATGELDRGRGFSPARCACWTSGCFASAPSSTPTTRAGSAWPPSRAYPGHTWATVRSCSTTSARPANDVCRPSGIRRWWRSISALRRRRSPGGEQLLAYREGRRWHPVRSEQISEFLKAQIGGAYSAKDFRTWNATVLAAVSLGADGRGARSTARHASAAINGAVRGVAEVLGNTPAVARRAYIDPRVFDRYLSGWTIGGELDRIGASARVPMTGAGPGWRPLCSHLLHDDRSSPAVAHDVSTPRLIHQAAQRLRWPVTAS